MLEKDIENLIAEHPEEFFPDLNLKLIGQQVRLGSYTADIIFEDGKGGKIIVEVKRGILSRPILGETIIQILDYYGELKQTNPKEDIKLVIVANVIPKERTLLLKERLGIEFKELWSEIISVAKKYNYNFSDSPSEEEIKEYKNKVKEIEESVASRTSKVWIFQANPKMYDIQRALSDKDIIQNEDVWEVNQHRSEIKKGDIGIIWMSGDNGGIYGIIDITSDPEYIKDSDYLSSKYWVSEEHKEKIKLRVRFNYKINLINNPIIKTEIKNILELKSMTIFRQPQGTNFPVNNEEWMIISKIIKDRLN